MTFWVAFWLVAGIAFWLVCGWLAYMMVRHHFRVYVKRWTVGDRHGWLSTCIMGGPLMLYASVATYLTWERQNDKTPSEW